MSHHPFDPPPAHTNYQSDIVSQRKARIKLDRRAARYFGNLTCRRTRRSTSSHRKVARAKPLFANIIERNEPCHLPTFFEARGADEVPWVNEVLTLEKLGLDIFEPRLRAREAPACPGTPGG